MTNVLLTDLGLSIPPKFLFESFIKKSISTTVDSSSNGGSEWTHPLSQKGQMPQPKILGTAFAW